MQGDPKASNLRERISVKISKRRQFYQFLSKRMPIETEEEKRLLEEKRKKID
jgi:hypothetical protein